MRKTSTLPGSVFVVIVGTGLAFAYFEYTNSAYGESLPIAIGANNNPPNATVAVNLTQDVNLTWELKNSANAGFNVTQSMFYGNSASECSKQLISFCNNNVPSQFICINQQYSNTVSGQYQRIYSTTNELCPQFVLAGNIACGIENNYCVVLYQKPN